MNRIPAKGRKISEISQDDIRVRIFGTVINKTESSLIIDDGSEKVEIIFDSLPEIEVGEKVRIIARVLPLANGFEVRGEVVQNMKGFDVEMYKKAREIIKSI